ncbi:glycosyltransferase family 4 protein [Nostoc sp. 106C]|uniref:glycosyltransferase family 4 protein n=1 Tax=Nostoc sp. 106C TaxID=1932667 RepID=UPI001FB8575A|nr:glycosyltransferase family 4 protein [Nostoc sp. 106C]
MMKKFSRLLSTSPDLLTYPNFKQDEKNSDRPLLTNTPSQPTIALLPYGDLIEDFLDSIGVSFEVFCNEFMGSWMFGYIDALQMVGVRTVLFCFSANVTEPSRFTHVPTGATICLLPAARIYRAYRGVRRQALNVSGVSENEKFSDVYATKSDRASLLVGLKDAVKNLGSYLSTPLRLLAVELRREGCNAILCQEYEYARFDACVLLGQLIHLPVFATFQGGDKLQSFLEYPLRPLAMRGCRGLIIPTQTEIQRVSADYGVSSAKIARIFNPLNIETWRAIDRNEARAALDIPLDASVVVWHGRVEIERKGLDVLLDAWKEICDKRPGKDLRLLLVGTGSDANKLHQRLETMQLRGVVWVNEFVRDRTRIQQYLSAADVYTLPSRQEGFPVAPVEAMACGLPIVAADAPGVPDILEEGETSGGLVVLRGDATALALALGRVLDDQTWGRELGKRARSRAENYFSPEAIGKQLSDFLLTQKVNGS